MRVLLYSEGLKYIQKSGVGKAISHQEKALNLNHIPCQVNGRYFNYDVVHINTIGPLSVIKANIARIRGKKVVMHAHSTEEDFRDSFFFANAIAPLFKQWLMFVYRQGDLLITPTPYSKELLEGYRMGRSIESISNGIDLDKFVVNKKEANRFRRKLGVDHKAKLVLSVGLQIKRKGIHDFISIARKIKDHEFVWCGYTSPYLMTSDIREAIENAPRNVHFPGYIDDLVGAYSAADVFFMPTYEETEGIVMLEALSMKKPIVVRDIPVYSSWLEHGVHCYKAKNNKEFVHHIKGLTTGVLKDLSDQGWKVAKERDIRKIGLELTRVYNSLVGEL